ncbi:hypothetical protein CEXT_772901 [Caerostris extrusa]|uniref:Uncharacterized protein n=1 Tax=Caerostris extrusa TaxID=172846 RepID=A0AAV4UM78_CAEEX|nr:hypothetical protein CEXT_772901 [Caerostris extrusa]
MAAQEATANRFLTEGEKGVIRRGLEDDDNAVREVTSLNSTCRSQVESEFVRKNTHQIPKQMQIQDPLHKLFTCMQNHRRISRGRIRIRRI